MVTIDDRRLRKPCQRFRVAYVGDLLHDRLCQIGQASGPIMVTANGHCRDDLG